MRRTSPGSPKSLTCAKSGAFPWSWSSTPPTASSPPTPGHVLPKTLRSWTSPSSTGRRRASPSASRPPSTTMIPATSTRRGRPSSPPGWETFSPASWAFHPGPRIQKTPPPGRAPYKSERNKKSPWKTPLRFPRALLLLKTDPPWRCPPPGNAPASCGQPRCRCGPEGPGQSPGDCPEASCGRPRPSSSSPAYG